jgi:predicted nucleic acid-binding protein
VPNASRAKLVYLDSSAIVKLIVAEPETPALMTFLTHWPDRVTSSLSRVEVMRAVKRARGDTRVRRRAARVLARVATIDVDEPVLAMAARLGPPELRTLDAIHLATARSLEAIAGVVTYDSRLGRAASRARLKTWAPA